MAIKALQKPVKKEVVKVIKEEKVKKFISKGGTLAESFQEQEGDHRLTLRIPKWLMDKVDDARKGRVGKISRNLWILEIIERATKG
jgi:hypothetical protein